MLITVNWVQLLYITWRSVPSIDTLFVCHFIVTCVLSVHSEWLIVVNFFKSFICIFFCLLYPHRQLIQIYSLHTHLLITFASELSAAIVCLFVLLAAFPQWNLRRVKINLFFLFQINFCCHIEIVLICVENVKTLFANKMKNFIYSNNKYYGNYFHFSIKCLLIALRLVFINGWFLPCLVLWLLLQGCMHLGNFPLLRFHMERQRGWERERVCMCVSHCEWLYRDWLFINVMQSPKKSFWRLLISYDIMQAIMIL